MMNVNHTSLAENSKRLLHHNKATSSKSFGSFKVVLLLFFVCIASTYNIVSTHHYLFIFSGFIPEDVIIEDTLNNATSPATTSTAAAAVEEDKSITTENGNIVQVVNDNNHQNKKDKAVMIIAAVPFRESRGLSLWSQLECFTGKIDKVIIAAADYSKELMDPFVAEVSQTIPHFRDGTTALEVRYYVNDRYDVGLWCDALNDGADDGADAINDVGEKTLSLSPLLQEYDQFILINDSMMAIQNSTELLDVLRSKQLHMVSLTYSLLELYWVESNYRGFDREGIRKLMDQICVPNLCLNENVLRKQHRCMVDTFEIPAADLFDRSKVWGLYHADTPSEILDVRPYRTMGLR